MYALILPALTPFVLLAGVMGLSWWEDHILPPADPVKPDEQRHSPVTVPISPGRGAGTHRSCQFVDKGCRRALTDHYGVGLRRSGILRTAPPVRLRPAPAEPRESSLCPLEFRP
ncbi:hypothetical protein FHS38_005498 [Streptomyces netropsis]|uniref:Uncharacterized protein n=1 Tax=Streptomyces netropsis TaxID=55404 RepID=A0A7W7LGU6_STRNE|nr:hypothetical protein [Streptomyces netropsis]GGR39973.1 hypothetical protein GCM10010219_51520 [Streptomyces netropsis]